jgi:hypothetical protein
MSEMKRGLQWNTPILSAEPTSCRNLHCSVIYSQNPWEPGALVLKSCKARFFQTAVCCAIGCASLLAGDRYPCRKQTSHREILLLHGLPSSSRMFQPLLTRLADHYHLIAPDYPGYGHSDWANPKQFDYTFDHYRLCDERLHADARPVALHALHAGLRWAGWLPHGIGTPRASAVPHRPGCGRSQRRPWSKLGNQASLLGGPTRS